MPTTMSLKPAAKLPRQEDGTVDTSQLVALRAPLVQVVYSGEDLPQFFAGVVADTGGTTFHGVLLPQDTPGFEDGAAPIAALTGNGATSELRAEQLSMVPELLTVLEDLQFEVRDLWRLAGPLIKERDEAVEALRLIAASVARLMPGDPPEAWGADLARPQNAGIVAHIITARAERLQAAIAEREVLAAGFRLIADACQSAHELAVETAGTISVATAAGRICQAVDVVAGLDGTGEDGDWMVTATRLRNLAQGSKP